MEITRTWEVKKIPLKKKNQADRVEGAVTMVFARDHVHFDVW